MGRCSFSTSLSFVIDGQTPVKKNMLVPIKVKGRLILVPKSAYATWERAAIKDLTEQMGVKHASWAFPIDSPVNVALRFFVRDRIRRDIVNLMQGPLDALVRAKVLADDRWTIVRQHDGCGVEIDKKRPRVEIEISRMVGDVTVA